MDSGSQLVNALLYGKLEGLSQETIFLYGRAGLLHLFSASGFHMAAALGVARVASRLLRPCTPERLRQGLGFTLSLTLMTFFGFVTEWSSPMVRAYAFTTLLSGAALAEVKPSRSWVFVLSLLAAAVLGKGSTLSFLLSAFGMAGVLCFGRHGMLGLSLGPWLFTLPLVIGAFGLISFSSPFWNLTLGLALSFTVMPLAIVDLVLEALGVPWRGLRELAAQGMELTTGILHHGEAWFGLSYWVDPWRFFPLALGLGFAALWQHRMRWPLALGLLAFSLLFPAPKLALLDVGQGDAVFLESAGGARVLVDAGPPGRREAPLNRGLEKLGIGVLDHLLLTHGDRDHIGGAPSLLSRHKVGTLWLREELLEDKRLLPVLEAVERARGTVRFVAQGRAPPDFLCWLPPFRGNEGSPFCHARLKGTSVWLTGDGGKKAERWVLARAELPKARFLKVGHHGSRGSSSEEFLRATGAQVALVSAGKRNRYGHPSPEVLQRLQGWQLRRTDREGTVVYRFFSDAIMRPSLGSTKKGTPELASRP